MRPARRDNELGNLWFVCQPLVEFDVRNLRQEGKTSHLFNLVGSVDSAIQRAQPDSQERPQNQPTDNSSRGEEKWTQNRGFSRDIRQIDDIDVSGFEARRDARFLEVQDQTLIKRAVRLVVLHQECEANHIVVSTEYLRLLALHFAARHLLVCAGG